MLVNICKKPTYLKASTDIRQLWYRKLRYASYIYIKYFIKMVDKIQFNYIYSFKDNDISKNN